MTGERLEGEARVTLHEEMADILGAHPTGMQAKEISDGIRARGRYRKKDGSDVDVSQIHARASKRHDLFERVGSKIRLRTSAPREQGEQRPSFILGGQYTREDVQRTLGLSAARGGNWDTGYHKHGDEWFLFPTLGTSRTGHDYGNRWEGTRLLWFGRTGSKQIHPSIQNLVAPGSIVHLFARERARDQFTYHGLVRPAQIRDTTPVEVLWEMMTAAPSQAIQPLAEEVTGSDYVEGAVRTVTVNAYERDPAARAACLHHWGLACAVCCMVMEARYGSIAEGFIHVHHLRPLAGAGGERAIDPVQDLRPVCPNCHAIIHLKQPQLSIEAAQALLRPTEA